LKFIYFPGRYRRAQANPGAPVRWYACTKGEFSYHASIKGDRPLCRRLVRLLSHDPRPEPPPDPSRDPWACPTCQELVRRVPTRKPASVRVLNQALTRALIG
jgi:hypothetical protein